MDAVAYALAMQAKGPLAFSKLPVAEYGNGYGASVYLHAIVGDWYYYNLPDGNLWRRVHLDTGVFESRAVLPVNSNAPTSGQQSRWSVPVGQYIYIFTNYSLTVYRYDTVANSWTTLTATGTTPSAGGGGAMATSIYNNRIYMHLNPGTTTNGFCYYDIAGNSFTDIAVSMGANLSGKVACGTNQKGGGVILYISASGTASFDPSTHTATVRNGPSLPYRPGLFSVDSEFYVVGGNANNSSSADNNGYVQRFTVAANSWTTIAYHYKYIGEYACSVPGEDGTVRSMRDAAGSFDATYSMRRAIPNLNNLKARIASR